jgi:hypothetical protein
VIPACRAKVYARPVRGRDSGRGESVRIGEAEPTADS